MRYKFRAWDENNEVMEYGVSVDNGRPVKEGYQLYHTGNTVYHSQLMQFTGLTDVNGREIYEGDIVSLQNPFDLINYKSLIIFKDGGFCAIDGTEENYAVRRYRLSGSDLEITVLGNIYEDGHLLKENE